MQLGDLEQKHSIELRVTLNGRTATFLTVLEQCIAHSALLSPILVNGKIVGFPPSCNISFIYPTQERVYVWYGVNVKAVRYKGKIYHSVDDEHYRFYKQQPDSNGCSGQRHQRNRILLPFFRTV